MNQVITVDGLGKRFGAKDALCDVSFSLAPGKAYGLIGPNGAGKTTTLQILLGILRPDTGRARVFGLDPSREADSVAIRGRIGYVPERHHIYRNMTCAQVLEFSRLVYPSWDRNECSRAAELFRLPLAGKVRDLSRGETAKLALVIALAPKPELLILDEPTSGLDPLVRREFLDAIAGLIREEQRTVLFSSHIMSDIERVADTVLMLDQGRLLEMVELEALRSRFRRVTFFFSSTPPDDMPLPAALSLERGRREWVAVFAGQSNAQLTDLADSLKADSFESCGLSLEEVFLTTLGRNPGGEAQ